MTHVALSLPDDALDWAQSRVTAGEAASLDSYLSDLVRRDREEKEELAWLQAEIDKGEASGVDPRSHDEIWDTIQARVFGPDA